MQRPSLLGKKTRVRTSGRLPPRLRLARPRGPAATSRTPRLGRGAGACGLWRLVGAPGPGGPPRRSGGLRVFQRRGGRKSTARRWPRPGATARKAADKPRSPQWRRGAPASLPRPRLWPAKQAHAPGGPAARPGLKPVPHSAPASPRVCPWRRRTNRPPTTAAAQRRPPPPHTQPPGVPPSPDAYLPKGIFLYLGARLPRATLVD